MSQVQALCFTKKIRNILISRIAKNYPGQTRAPNPNGINENFAQGSPLGVRKYFEDGSNLSGINSVGFIHWSLL